MSTRQLQEGLVCSQHSCGKVWYVHKTAAGRFGMFTRQLREGLICSQDSCGKVWYVHNTAAVRFGMFTTQLQEGLVCSQHSCGMICYVPKTTVPIQLLLYSWLSQAVAYSTCQVEGDGRLFVYVWCFSFLPGVWCGLVASLIARVHIILVTRQLIFIPYVFFHAKSKHVIRIALSPTVFVWQNFF